MKLTIVRHGQTDWNVAGKLQGATDIPLNDAGIEQAKRCAIFLQPQPFDFIVTSPLQRAYKTGQIIAGANNLPLIVIDEWRERSFGDVEGMTLDERNAKFPSFDYPNAEPFAALQARIHTALAKTAQLEGANGIVVAHGGIINALLALLSNGEIGTGKTRLANGSMSTIERVEQQWQICTVNDISHIA